MEYLISRSALFDALNAEARECYSRTVEKIIEEHPCVNISGRPQTELRRTSKAFMRRCLRCNDVINILITDSKINYCPTCGAEVIKGGF